MSPLQIAIAVLGYVIVGIIVNLYSEIWFYPPRNPDASFYTWDKSLTRILLWWFGIFRMLWLK